MQYGGEVQEMVGDRFLAVFNGTSPCPDHAMHIINAARENMAAVWRKLPNTLSQGLEPMSLSVGIETGVFCKAASAHHNEGCIPSLGKRLQWLFACV